MSGGQYTKLNILIEFSNSVFIKFYFKILTQRDWHRTCIENNLACLISSILTCSFALQV